jgi:rare lipoprotein A
VKGVWYTPRENPDYDELGIASWYGDAFQLRATASGEPFDMYMPSAAHKTLPLQSIVEVTNLENGRRIQVRINDRGPFVDGRIIDLSRAAAEDLGMLKTGVARVRVRFVGVAGTQPQPPIVVASNRRRETARPSLETQPAAFDPRDLDATPLSALY